MESLVAITVLLIGVLGPLVLATRSISEGISTKNKVAASYLAQEGIELVLLKRELNVFDDWRDGLTPNASDTNKQVDCTTGCMIQDDGSTVTVVPCDAINCKINLGSGPQFERKIKIIEAPPLDRMISVTSEVTWVEKGVSKDYTLKTFLYKKNA